MDWSSSLLTVTAQAAAPSGGSSQATPSSMSMIPVLVIVMVLFYVLIILPQKKGQKQTEDMRNSIQSGDKVKSIGGIYGTVTAVDTTNNIVTVQVDKNVKIDFDRNAIATVIKK